MNRIFQDIEGRDTDKLILDIIKGMLTGDEVTILSDGETPTDKIYYFSPDELESLRLGALGLMILCEDAQADYPESETK